MNAVTIFECQALIASLRIETETAVMPANNADKLRPALLNKLDSASVSLDRAKLCDALRRLDDYRVKVNQLVVSGADLWRAAEYPTILARIAQN